MSPPERPSKYPWLLTLFAALIFLGWVQWRRAERVHYLSQLGASNLPLDANSGTGYADGQRRLIGPGQNKESFQWIMQTQQMAATGTSRVRRVDYDNAPLGRPVQSPSPYRWWLGAVGWLVHVVHGIPIGAGIELAAIAADPLLNLVLVVGLAIFVARRFGAWPSALVTLAAVALYPFGGAFLPGAPSDLGLSLLLVAGSTLPLIASQLPGANFRPQSKISLLLAGVAGGLGLWVNPGIQVPVLIATCLGAGAALLVRPPDTSGGKSAPTSAPMIPWRSWAVSGTITAVIGFLLENAPDRLNLDSLNLSENHPLYALAWLGAGQLLHDLASWKHRPAGKVRIPLSVLAALAVLAVPAVLYFKGQKGFLTPDTYATALTNLGTWIEADTLSAWWQRDGLTLALFATLTPCLFIAIALWQYVSQPAKRAALLVALLPILTAMLYGCLQLSWWNVMGTLLFGLLAVLTTTVPGAKPTAETRILWIGAFALFLGPGLAALWPAGTSNTPASLTKTEADSLVERDLARWIARRTGPDGAIVLAPPSLTISCLYYGGSRGLGTPFRENEEGFRASVRIAGATSADEAYALAKQRKLTHILVPSWDDFLDTYALLGSNQPEHTLIGQLRTFRPPRWLKPVAYPLTGRPGASDDAYVFVFDMTELQDGVTGLSRAAEYFVEMNQLQLARDACKALAESFAGDLNALAARAQHELARKNRTGFLALLAEIETGLAQGTDEALPWDRRVSLALVLAAGPRTEQTRTQVARCLEEMGEYDLRGLSTGRLAEFTALARTLGLKAPSAELEKLIAELLGPKPAGEA